MKNLVFEIPVKQLLLSKEWSNEKCDDLAKKISLHYFGRKTSDEIINNFIFVILAVGDIRDRFLGRNREIGRVNMFCNIIGEYAAYMLIGDERVSRRIAAECAKAAPDEVDNYLSMKLKSLLMNLNHVNRLFSYYEDNYSKIVKNVETFTQKLGSENQSIDQVFAELLNMRKYGVKSSAFSESIISLPGDFWIYSPADYMVSMYEANTDGVVGWQLKKKNEFLSQRIITSVSVSNHRNIDLSPVPLVLETGQETFMLSTDSKADFAINFKGELSIASTIADMNLRSAFERSGKSELYEMIRANAIFRLYDLIVPVYVEKAYSVPRFPDRGIIGAFFPKSVSFDPMLYLRRIRVLFDNLIHINKGLELEFEESISTKPSQLKREHDVVCHIRKLGNGYQPSTRARKLAREILGYELKEGETFVCKHSRGKGGVKSDQIHLAVKRH